MKFGKLLLDCMIVLIVFALGAIVVDKIENMQFTPQQLPTISISDTAPHNPSPFADKIAQKTGN